MTAANGQQIPSSILYANKAGGKTNCLPIHAMCDLLNKEIIYNSASKTVHLGADAASNAYIHLETNLAPD